MQRLTTTPWNVHRQVGLRMGFEYCHVCRMVQIKPPYCSFILLFASGWCYGFIKLVPKVWNIIQKTKRYLFLGTVPEENPNDNFFRDNQEKSFFVFIRKFFGNCNNLNLRPLGLLTSQRKGQFWKSIGGTVRRLEVERAQYFKARAKCEPLKLSLDKVQKKSLSKLRFIWWPSSLNPNYAF